MKQLIRACGLIHRRYRFRTALQEIKEELATRHITSFGLCFVCAEATADHRERN